MSHAAEPNEKVESVEQQNQAENQPYNLVRLALNENADHKPDHVKDKRNNEKRYQRSNHRVGLLRQ